MTNVIAIGIGVLISGCARAYVGLYTGPQMGLLICGIVLVSAGVLTVVHEGFEIARDQKRRQK